MPSHPPAAASAAPCLTHHQILALAEPFLRRGYRLDLAGSDRSQRRLRFEPDAFAGRPGTPRESLLLDSPAEGRFRLTRRFEIDCAPAATLQCEGDDAARLLQNVQAVDGARHFVHGDRYLIVWHRHLHPDGTQALTGATALLQDLTMTMSAPRAGAGRAAVDVRAHAGRLNLPEDLFAVLGRDWSLLQREGPAWRFSLRVRGGNAPQRFERGVRHLQRAMAEPPRRFHQRHLLARWAVTARRSMLLAAWASLLMLVAAAEPLWLARTSAWPLLLPLLPLGLLWGCYQFPDLPRLRWPRRPRPPDQARWLEPQS